ncbi:unnamed protein product, partial [marine sediment metagenome]
MSQGFHPKPRMTFPLALAVGIEGSDEVMELELSESCTAPDVLTRVAPHAPPGLTFTSAEVVPQGCKKARVRSVSYQAPIPASCREGLQERIDQLMASSSWPLSRPGRNTTLDLRAQLEDLS